MSRIRITLDSVTKAVGSTDLISKFSWLKAGSGRVDGTHAEKALAKVETLTSNSTASPPETAMKVEDEGEKSTAEEEADKEQQEIIEKPFVSAKKSTSTLASAASISVPSSNMAKQTMQLLQPAALSTNMDETYKTLANHINAYFGPGTPGEDGENRQQHREGDGRVPEPVPQFSSQMKRDHIPVLSPAGKSTEAPTTSPVPASSSERPSVEAPSAESPAAEGEAQSAPVPTASPRKGFTHYLSYPRPSVQAFVGSYIAPLVPKFRGDSKKMSNDKPSAVAVDDAAVEKEGERTESEDEKAEKAKQQLLTQREKVGC